jgi:hypothetical protein
MTGNKRNYERITEILQDGKILTTREVYEQILNTRSITKTKKKTKRRTHIPTFKGVQNLLQSSPDVERANPHSTEKAKWKLRDNNGNTRI